MATPPYDPSLTGQSGICDSHHAIKPVLISWSRTYSVHATAAVLVGTNLQDYIICSASLTAGGDFVFNNLLLDFDNDNPNTILGPDWIS